jgi:hypothetical protein
MVVRSTEIVGHLAIGGTTEREEHAAENHRDKSGDGEIPRLTSERVSAEADDD